MITKNTHNETPRETQARVEVGATEVSRPLQWFMVVVFLTTILSIPLYQNVVERDDGLFGESVRIDHILPSSEGLSRVIIEANYENFSMLADNIRENMSKYEDGLESNSRLSQLLTPPLNQAPIKASSSEITRAAGVTKGIAASCSTPSEGAAKPPSIDEIISAERAAREATAQDSLRPGFNTRYRILKEGEFGQVASNESYRSSGGNDKSLVYGLIVLIIMQHLDLMIQIIIECIYIDIEIYMIQ